MKLLPVTSPAFPKCRDAAARGFTLAELMAVVAIMGILATLAMVGYSKYIDSARSSEATSMVNAIRAAQERYRAETLTYLDVSSSLATYYPTTTPAAVKVQWGGGTDAVSNKWRMLNVSTGGAVYYGYATIAGGPGAVTTTGLAIANAPTFPAAVEPWYLVQAKGNVDGDNDYSYCVASSFSNDIYWEKEGE